jgi:hypothetical protein
MSTSVLCMGSPLHRSRPAFVCRAPSHGLSVWRNLGRAHGEISGGLGSSEGMLCRSGDASKRSQESTSKYIVATTDRRCLMRWRGAGALYVGFRAMSFHLRRGPLLSKRRLTTHQRRGSLSFLYQAYGQPMCETATYFVSATLTFPS